MDDPLQSLVDAHLLIGLERHTWIDELLAGRERTLDPNGRVLHVEPDHQVPVHRLARLGRADGRWTWAWANGGPEDPSRSVSQSLAELALEELGRPAFSPPIDPEILALVCAALADAQTWIRLEGDGADEILLVDGPPEDPPRSPPLSLHAMNLVDRELSAGRGLVLNRAAVLAYLEALGLPVSVTDEEIDLQDGSDVRFEFDRHGRVAWTGTIPVTRSTAPYPQVGEPQGSPLVAFNPPDLERSPGWRDADGVSPIGLLRRYLTERHAWEIAANDSPPEDWGPLQERLAAIHAAVSTDKPATERDTSFGDPPSRDPQRTRVLDTLHDALDHARVRVQQDHPYGMDVFEFEFVKVLDRWRIADRVQVFDDGERVAGLL